MRLITSHFFHVSCWDHVYFLFFLVKIVFSFFFSWSRSCLLSFFLGQDRVYFLFFLVEGVFSFFKFFWGGGRKRVFFFLKTFLYKFPPQKKIWKKLFESNERSFFLLNLILNWKMLQQLYALSSFSTQDWDSNWKTRIDISIVRNNSNFTDFQ